VIPIRQDSSVVVGGPPGLSAGVAGGYNAGMSEAQPVPSDDQMILPLCAIFRRFLKRQGLKFTTERAKILDAVLAKVGVFEADELLQEMRAADQRVSKATIYRTLKHLMEAKIISEVLIDSRQAHYRLSFGKEPKGHLVCVETNQIIEFSAGDLTELRDRLCKEHGFDPVSHRFVIYGISPEAQKAEQAEEVEEV
jgi:Fur family transcriptional regulator, ferric uptake regulator